MPVDIFGMIQYNNVMVFIGPFYKLVQSVDKCYGVINVLIILLSQQTLQSFNENGVEIFHQFKEYYNEKNFEYFI